MKKEEEQSQEKMFLIKIKILMKIQKREKEPAEQDF